ncbi:MAG: sugar-binding domain-containing protein, partial [Ferruginibacter sp.]
MKKNSIIILSIFISYNSFTQIILFDDDWRFHRGDFRNGERKNINEGNWRKIDLPHDFSIEDLPGLSSPFNRDALNGPSAGFTTGGTGWYRKSFTIPVRLRNKKMMIQFDGVYMNADVWLNGEHLGNHPYGYTSFYYDITRKIKAGEKNVLAVQVKNHGATSRWY